MPLAYAILHEGDQGFGISFPDFPGCISGGPTEDDAIRRATEALNFHVSGMVEDGDVLPHPRTLAELKSDPVFVDSLADGFLTIVPFELPGKSVRINVSIDENLLDAIDKAAQAKGQSRSAYLADAARARIRSAA